MPLTHQEAIEIAKLINPQLDIVLAQYDFTKYPANQYQSFKQNFSSLPFKNNQLSSAILWKYGKYGQVSYPAAYTKLITKISDEWGNFVGSTAAKNSQQTFYWWKKTLNRKTTYITEAYITHLVHHNEPLPIIDQHNFRAMNYLKLTVRAGEHSYNKKPSTWNDIQSLKQFMVMLLPLLQDKTPGQRCSFGDLDRFLMMYGRNTAPR